jgi:hypothetical protein
MAKSPNQWWMSRHSAGRSKWKILCFWYSKGKKYHFYILVLLFFQIDFADHKFCSFTSISNGAASQHSSVLTSLHHLCLLVVLNVYLKKRTCVESMCIPKILYHIWERASHADYPLAGNYLEILGAELRNYYMFLPKILVRRAIRNLSWMIVYFILFHWSEFRKTKHNK